jgi:16S rRNA (uracil1498-N3)-methyltransferase
MRRRFFVEHFDARAAALRGDAAEHLGRVLRAEAGQLYELSDGEKVWLARIERVALTKRGESRIDFALVEPIEAHESTPRILLLISIIKFDRFEWCLEKATELGVAQIIPLAAARTDKTLIAAASKRLDRWQKILRESAQQSRQLRPPEIAEPLRPERAFALAAGGANIVLSERAGASPLRLAAAKAGIGAAAFAAAGAATSRSADRGNSVPQPVTFATGPEGGWTDEELEAARAAGFAEASLGENILRTETAVLSALAVLRFSKFDAA